MRGLLLAAVVLLVAGCGSAERDTATSRTTNGFNRPSAPAATEAQVAHALGVVKDDAGIAWEGADGCIASVIMTTPQEVQLYADAGDPVATNPAGTVGVKVGTTEGGMSERGCFDRFQQRLKNL